MRHTLLTPILLGVSALALLNAAAARAADPAPAAAPAPTIPAPPAGPAAPAAPPAAPTMKGPVVAGVCVISQQDVIGESKLGVAAQHYLQDLAKKSQSEYAAEQNRLLARGKALDSKRATMTPLEMQKETLALNQRARELQDEAGQRSRQIDAAKTRVFGKVLAAAQSTIADVYTAHGCGLLLAREVVVAGNLANDITDEVAAKLDSKGVMVSFDEPPAAK